MEATLAPATPAQLDFRAELHQVIDQIQDEAVLRATLLLAPQVAVPEIEPELNSAQLEELDRRIAQYDPSKNVPFSEVMHRLTQAQA